MTAQEVPAVFRTRRESRPADQLSALQAGRLMAAGDVTVAGLARDLLGRSAQVRPLPGRARRAEVGVPGAVSRAARSRDAPAQRRLRGDPSRAPGSAIPSEPEPGEAGAPVAIYSRSMVRVRGPIRASG